MPGTDTVSPYNNPQSAIGTPNGCGENAVALGHGGVLTVKFTNNYLIDVEGADLHVFECGGAVEPFKVDISKDGSSWINLGTVSGQPTSIDIHGKVAPGDKFSYVRLTDAGGGSGHPYAGADIDAVGAIGAEERPDSDGDGVPDDIDECLGTPAGVAVDEKGCPKYSDLESNWTVDDILSLKGQIAGVVPNAGNAGEITGEPGLSDPTTDREKIEARLAEIEKLSDKEREKYRDELAQLYDQLYLVNRHEELVWMLVGGLITVTDKSMGYYTPTALVWGISTGLTTLIRGDFEDGMNRLIGAIPWKNIGTAYSAILDAHNLRPDGPGYRYQASQSPLVVLPPVP